MGIRFPIVAGQFYPEDPLELENEIKNSFLSPKGPGRLPSKRGNSRVLGVIAPHAGYMFSGPCAAWSYLAIAESQPIDVFIIMGPNHTGRGRTSTITDDWKTPFGIVKCDIAVARLLAANSNIEIDPTAHTNEHSIEIQLPFLQFINKHMHEDPDSLRFVPVVLGHDCNIEELSLGIKKTILQSGKRVCIIASSDFTHYGFNYAYVPFSENIKERIYDLDRGALNFIERMDAEGFLDYINRTGATICGAIPIAVLIKSLDDKAEEVKVLQYYTSADVIGDYSSAVGYGSVVFK